jgi:dolichyl-phosphate-mannose-protein mannosyltransferase
MGTRLRHALVFVGLAGVLLCLKWPTLGDPPFWDENCYVPQSRFIAAHGADWAAYRRELGFLRPPVYTGMLAAVIRAGGSDIRALRVFTCLLGSLLLPATFLLVRRLGGSRRAGWLAALLVGASPLYLAQIGLVESDAPVALAVVVAWILLLGGRTWGFVVASLVAVWTKESAYFLCAPAALLLYFRHGRRIVPVWPALVPGLALFAWLGVHWLIMGVAIPSINAGTIGPRYLEDALRHSLLEGGRVVLVPLALLALRDASDRLAVRATAAAIFLFPILFMGPLPRYALPTLPFLAALAAMALDRARLRLAAPALAGLAALYAWNLSRDSAHTAGGHHMDANLGYRELLLVEKRAAQAVAAEHPGKVLAAFPMYSALTLGPEDHFLPAPVPTAVADGQPLATLCDYDLLVESAQGEPAEPAASRLRAAHALQPLAEIGPPDKWVRISRIACQR